MNDRFHPAAILAACLVAAAAAWAGPAPTEAPAASAGWVAQQAPGFYRFRLGALRVTVLSDGTAPRDLPKIMSRPDDVRAAFDAAHQALPVELAINCYLIDAGSRRVLVDTGAGELFGSSAGMLVANLRAAGYRPEDVDDILLTHIHADHSGGLSVGGQPVFPNAVVHVDRRDLGFWLNADQQAIAPANRRTTFAQSHQTVDPVARAGHLRTFDGATEVLPGIRSLPEYGHTPGLSGYVIESQGQRLLLWGDIVHAAEAQFRDPSITIEYDVDPAQAVATRRRVLQEASRSGWLVGGAHLSFPGLGHVRDEGDGRYAWVPVPWTAAP